MPCAFCCHDLLVYTSQTKSADSRQSETNKPRLSSLATTSDSSPTTMMNEPYVLDGDIIWEISGDLMPDLSTPLLDVTTTDLTNRML